MRNLNTASSIAKRCWSTCLNEEKEHKRKILSKDGRRDEVVASSNSGWLDTYLLVMKELFGASDPEAADFGASDEDRIETDQLAEPALVAAAQTKKRMRELSLVILQTISLLGDYEC